LEKLKSDIKDEQLEGLRGLQKMGLCFKQDLEKVSSEVRKKFAKEVDLNKLSDRAIYYRMELGERFVKVVSSGIRVAAGGIAATGGLIKSFPNLVNDPANIAGYGAFAPMRGGLESGALAMRGVFQITAEAMDETFGSFLYKTTALQDRVVKKMPTNAQIKQAASFVTNKAIGVTKWAAIYSAIGAWVGNLFGFEVGAVAGGFYGLCATDGRVQQMPSGGFIRAIKFGGAGALVGSLVPVVLGAIVGGLALAGLIASASALTVATMGLSLIIPCLFLGAIAGYHIAGWTGKDEDVNVEDPVVRKLEYKVPTFQVAKALLLE